MSIRGVARDGINAALRPLGVQLVRGWSADPAIQPFLRARKTLAAARRESLSVGEYVDRFSAEPGATAAAVHGMLALAAFDGEVRRVCEIGPGTGRYAEKVIEALRPDRYEVYETARDWLPHLRTLPHAVIQPADGHALSSTASGSVDFVHAQKLFAYLPFVTSVGYMEEMARVVRPGGIVAFDVVNEHCMGEEATRRWVDGSATIYALIPRQWMLDRLDPLGLRLLGSLFVPLSGATTELMVFRRESVSG